MNAPVLKDMFSNIRLLIRRLSPNPDSFIADPLSRRFLLALFAFFYPPILYYYGYLLPPSVGIDFPSYFYAARWAFLKFKTPYGLNAFSGIIGHVGGKVQPYIYPPPSLLAFWPLAVLSTANARVVFLTVSHLCFLGSIWLILVRLTPFPRDPRLHEIAAGLSLIYMLCSFSALDTFAAGQVNFMALFFICLALVALKQGASAWRIALPLSIAILLKTYPVLLFLPLLFRKRFRAIIYTCLFLAAFTLIAALVLPHDVWRTWFLEIVPLGGYANDRIPAAYCWNQSINAFVMRLFQENFFSKAPLYYPFLARPVATILALLVVGVTIFFSFRASKQNKGETSANDDIAAYLLMIYLVAPLSWDHHLVYIFPAAVLAISLLVGGSVRGKLSVTIAASLLLLAWRFPVDRLDIVSGWWTLLISAKLYPVVVLWLFFINRLHRSVSAPLSYKLPSQGVFQNETGRPEASFVG